MPRSSPIRLKPIEVMIVLAILGITASVLVPAIQQANRGARGSHHGVTPASDRSTEGQYNTIEPPQTAKHVNRDPVPASRPAFGWVAQVAIAAAIIRAVSVLRRRGNRRLVQKPRHKHPPHDAS